MQNPFADKTAVLHLWRIGMPEVLRENMDMIEDAIVTLQGEVGSPGPPSPPSPPGGSDSGTF